MRGNGGNMKSEDFAWNAHERECYENGQVSLPSPYKIKILDYGQKRLKLEQILTQVQEVFEARLEDKVSAYELRKAGFLAQQLSQQAKSPVSKYAARVFAQAVATAHMRGHAIVSADYAVKVINLQSPDDMKAVISERKQQIRLAKEWQKCINEL